MEKNLAYYPDIMEEHIKMMEGKTEAELIEQNRERLRILGEEFKGMFVVIDNEGFPMWPTVSLDEETAIARMVKLGPDKPWQYYLDKGNTVEKVTITIKKEMLPL